MKHAKQNWISLWHKYLKNEKIYGRKEQAWDGDAVRMLQT